MCDRFFIKDQEYEVKTKYELFTKESNSLGCNNYVIIHKILNNQLAIAINISLINASPNPYQLLNMSLEKNNFSYEALKVTKTGVNPMLDKMCFTTHMNCFEFDIPEQPDKKQINFTLNQFNTQTFLSQYQAETGWIIFYVTSDDLKFDNFVFQISTHSNNFYLRKK